MSIDIEIRKEATIHFDDEGVEHLLEILDVFRIAHEQYHGNIPNDRDPIKNMSPDKLRDVYTTADKLVHELTD